VAPIILFTDEVTGLSPGFGGYASQFGYDFEGNLTGITAAGSSAVSFEYDGLDRQLGWQSGGTGLDYQLDGDTTLTETNQTTARVNLYGNGLVSSGGETLLYDGLGAVRQTTDAGQNVVSSSAYYGFGQTIASGGSTGNHYQWGASSGYRSDGFGPADAAPLMKVGARYYDPELGVFLTRDADLTQKPYAYCDGDPVNFTDPSGHSKLSDWWKHFLQQIQGNPYAQGQTYHLSKDQWNSVFKDMQTIGTGEQILGASILGVNIKGNPTYIPGQNNPFIVKYGPVWAVGGGLALGGTVARGIGMAGQYYTSR